MIIVIGRTSSLVLQLFRSLRGLLLEPLERGDTDRIDDIDVVLERGLLRVAQHRGRREVALRREVRDSRALGFSLPKLELVPEQVQRRGNMALAVLLFSTEPTGTNSHHDPSRNLSLLYL